jgi:hypothetical protein
MSTPPTAIPAKPSEAANQELKVVSHSTLYYWWPVWAVGFLMAGLTALEGDRLAIVPEGTTVTARSENDYDLHLARKPTASLLDAVHPPPGREAFPLHVSANKNFGVLFLVVLLLVIFITNIPLRGMWSVFVISLFLLLSLVFALFGWWDPILESLGRVHVHITLAGYLLPSLVLFLAWLLTVFVFDGRRYVVFSPGQIRVHQELGGSEQVYDATGMHFRKQRSDLFRHWILGLGSGDLVVDTAGAQPQHIELPNVLFVGRKEQQIATLMQTRAVIP